jgi:hypothetical protein
VPIFLVDRINFELKFCGWAGVCMCGVCVCDVVLYVCVCGVCMCGVCVCDVVLYV